MPIVLFLYSANWLTPILISQVKQPYLKYVFFFLFLFFVKIKQDHYAIIGAGELDFGSRFANSTVSTGKERYNQKTDKGRGEMIGLRGMK